VRKRIQEEKREFYSVGLWLEQTCRLQLIKYTAFFSQEINNTECWEDCRRNVSREGKLATAEYYSILQEIEILNENYSEFHEKEKILSMQFCRINT